MKYFICIAWFFCGLLHPLNAFAPKQIPSVLVIGHGFMGANHVKNLELLQQQGEVIVAGVVDTDSARLKGVPYPCFSSVQSACKQLSPDIVVIVSNTQTHYGIIQEVLTAFQGKELPALFVEKPLVETSSQAIEIAAVLEGKGYGKEIPISCGYLFRNTPIIDSVIEYIKHNKLTLEKVNVCWQKKRVPTRPSAGVHIDEATHPIDLILNRIFPGLGIASAPLSIACFERKYDISIVDEKQQNQLYKDEPEKIIPLALVDYELKTPQIKIQSFSSFATAPQIREIILQCSDQCTLKLVYDKDQTDYLEVDSPKHKGVLLRVDKPNKLLDEWKAFLKYYHSGALTPDLASIRDMITDIQITESLDTVPLSVQTFQ